MRKTSIMFALGLVGCGGGSDTPPDAGPPGPDADTGPGTAISYTVHAFGGWQPEPDDVVLVRDDDGPWVELADDGNGVFRGRVIGPRYAVARACRTADLAYGEVWIYHLTLDDTPDLVDTGCRGATGLATISGSLTGVEPGRRAVIATPDASVSRNDFVGSYAVGSRHGRIDLFAREFTPGSDRRVQRVMLERDLDIAGDLDHPLDFAAAVAPDEHQVVVAGTGAGEFEGVGVTLTTANGAYTVESSTGATDTYRIPPASLLRAGDLISVIRTTGAGDASRTVTIVSATATDLSAALAPAYQVPDPTRTVTATSVGLSGTLPVVDGADYYAVFAVQQDANTLQFMNWSQTYSARWAAGAAIDYEFPDFSGVGGWTVGLRPDFEATWFADVFAASPGDPVSPYANAPGYAAAAGDVTTRSGRSGVIAPAD